MAIDAVSVATFVAEYACLSKAGCAAVLKEHHVEALEVFVGRMLRSRGADAGQGGLKALTKRVSQARSPSKAWNILQIEVGQFQHRGSGTETTPWVLGNSHKPARQRANDAAYLLHQAASEGWLPCVRQLLEQLRREEEESRNRRPWHDGGP